MYERLSQCPLCKSGHFSNFMVVKDHAVSLEAFSICRCSSCNFLFTNPRPDQAHIQQYYESQNYISHKDKANNLTNILYKTVRIITIKQKIAWLNQFAKPKGRLLDFGCGTGYFLKAAEKDGWEVVGYEPNPDAAAIAIRQHHLTILHEYEALELSKKFDAICLFHVLEHIHDLDGTMQLLLGKLKKRGTLFVAVPNINAYDAQLYKENWAALDVPRHLYHFTSETMEKFASVNKLKIRTIKPMVFDSFYVSMLSESYINSKNKIINSLKNGFQSNKLAKKENNYSSLLFVLRKA